MSTELMAIIVIPTNSRPLKNTEQKRLSQSEESLNFPEQILATNKDDGANTGGDSLVRSHMEPRSLPPNPTVKLHLLRRR